MGLLTFQSEEAVKPVESAHEPCLRAGETRPHPIGCSATHATEMWPTTKKDGETPKKRELQGIQTLPNHLPSIWGWNLVIHSPKICLAIFLLPFQLPSHEILLSRKRNEIGSFIVMWMDSESFIQSEASQQEKNKYHILTYRCGI